MTEPTNLQLQVLETKGGLLQFEHVFVSVKGSTAAFYRVTITKNWMERQSTTDFLYNQKNKIIYSLGMVLKKGSNLSR